MTYFRCWPSDDDPSVLLEPSEQYSTPWGEPELGPCDKCGCSGETEYRCRSCLIEGTDPECLACGGRTVFVNRCPTCEGTGEITRTKRRGVSAFPALNGLYRYLGERAERLDHHVVLELEGELSDDEDLDADAGAVLVYPSTIVAERPIDRDRIAELMELSLDEAAT